MNNEYTLAQEYNHQGLILYSKDKYEEALSYFNKAMENDPYFIESYINAAQVYIMQDQFEDAKKYLNKALLIDKKAAVVYFHLGNIALLQGETEEARTEYNKAVSLGYDNDQIYVNLASDAEDRGDFETAMNYYNRAIAINKFNPYPKARKVQILIQLKKYAEALSVCDSLIETNPDIFEGYHYKFALLTELNKMEEAEVLLDRAIQLFPDDEAFFYDKARLYQSKGEFEKALAIIDEKINMNDDNRTAMVSFKSELLLATEKVDEAEKLVDEEFYKSHDGEIAFLRNSIAIAKKEYDKVLECSKFILDNNDIDNYYYAAMYYHALALNKLGRTEDAKAAFEEALLFFRAACSKTPGQLQLYFYRAMCHEELKQYDNALELTEYILNVDNDIAEVHMLRSKIFEAMGNSDKAQGEINQAKSINPDIVKMLEG